MRNIRGDLGLVGIENLLQMLSSAKCEGTLAVVMESQKKVIHIGPQGIRLIHSARRTPPLGEILVRSGKITRARLDELLAEQRRGGERLGDLLARRGIVSKEELDYALREQITEEIYDLFGWKGAMFTFTEGGAGPAPDSPLAEITLAMDVMFVILEAGRRADEMMRISTLIPDERMIPVRVELPTAADAPDLDRQTVEAIYPLIDGESSVAQILGKSLFPKFTVLRTLYGLAQRGAVKIYRQEGDGPQTVLRRPAPAARPAAGGRTVALLSPLPAFRATLASHVQGAGYRAVEGDRWPGPDGTPGVREADVIVLDTALGTPEGQEACRQVRESAKVPFIVLTSAAGREAVVQAIESGARYALLKPVRPELLLERLADALREAGGESAATS